MQPWVIVPLPSGSEATALVPVAGEPPLVRVVRSVLGVTAQERIVVACAAALIDAAGSCLRAAGLDAVAVVAAGAPGTRRQVLVAGLKACDVQRHSKDAVLLCDCRHPLVPGAVADRVTAALTDGHDVVVPTLPVTDTVKTVDAFGSVLGTVDRTTLRSVQYPRGFTATALWDVVATPNPTQPAAAAADVDELEAAFRIGLDVGTVAGDPNGLQVALPRDARLVEAIIATAGS